MKCSGVGAAGGGTRMTGHAGGKPAGHWDFALPGPGAVEATVGDLARYLSACLTPPPGPLGAAIRLCEQPRVRMGDGNAGGLAWIVTGGLLFHNGGTGGFSASVAIDQAAGHAVGALVNTHGRSVSLLDAAVITAVNGGDPRHARPQGTWETAGPEWEQRAREMAQALLDGKFTERPPEPKARGPGQAERRAPRPHVAVRAPADRRPRAGLGLLPVPGRRTSRARRRSCPDHVHGQQAAAAALRAVYRVQARSPASASSPPTRPLPGRARPRPTVAAALGVRVGESADPHAPKPQVQPYTTVGSARVSRRSRTRCSGPRRARIPSRTGSRLRPCTRRTRRSSSWRCWLPSCRRLTTRGKSCR